jgi:hypothetical protein
MVIRTKPNLWKKIVKKWKKSDKGGEPGKWSARKAQLAVREYINSGGDYLGKKKEDNSLALWTKQDWGYIYGDKTGRYLPKKVREILTRKEKLEENRIKRKAREEHKDRVKYTESVLDKFRKVVKYPDRYKYSAKLTKLPKGNKKKYKVLVVNNDTQKRRTVRFGAQGYSDYTMHNDDERKSNYINRHKKREDWEDPFTAGFWSRWLLWNKKTIEASKRDIKNNFSIKFV